MTISTYAELQDQVYKFLLRDSSDLVITTAQVQTFIQLCEAELNRELKIRILQDSATVSTVADQAYASLPTDFREVIDFKFSDSPVGIKWVTPEEYRLKYTGLSGRPEAYTIIGTRIYFGPTPAAIHTLNLDYYKKIPALTDSNTTNVILTDHPDVYLYGALKHAGIQITDAEKLQNVNSNYVSIVERIKENDKFEKVPVGARMRPKSGAIGG